MVVLVVTIFEIHGDPQPFHPKQEGCAGGDGDRFRGTRRSSDPTSPICHQAAPGPCWKSKSEFHQDVTVAGNYHCSFFRSVLHIERFSQARGIVKWVGLLEMELGGEIIVILRFSVGQAGP